MNESPNIKESPDPQRPGLSVEYISEKLVDAELLLAYAAETGIKVDDAIQRGVLKARLAKDGAGFTEETASILLSSLTALAEVVKPVTVESLNTCANKEDVRGQIESFRRVAIAIGIVILVFSFGTFISSRVSERISADVTTANGLASKLSAELGPPPPTNSVKVERKEPANNIPASSIAPEETRWGQGGPPRGVGEKEVITDLQQFAANMREIDGFARQLRPFVLYLVADTDAELRTNGHFQLTPGLTNLLSREFAQKVQVYQEVRDFGNNITETVAVYYGAMAACVLPVLYALLGAEAYLLRSYEDQIKNHTFTSSGRRPARYLVAGIGGMVVGLFNVAQGITLSPFAIAFLVGYAADIFFAFLDGSLQMFKRTPGDPGAQLLKPKPAGN
jgi:hypothetical protein